MSNIFDALQRSESERPERGSIGLPEATDLLMLAERRAAAKWQNSHELRQADTPEQDRRDSSGGAEADGFRATPTQSAVADTNRRDSARSDALASALQLQISTKDENRLVCLNDPENPATEAYRLLGVRVRDFRRERPAKKLLVTSSIPGEGKSLTAANLAVTLATSAQERVLLLEGDLRAPSLARIFGLGTLEGLSDCIKKKGKLSECISQLDEARIWFAPAGTPVSDPLDLLQSPRLPLILDELAAIFDWIIIDTPPLLPAADTTVWTRLSDAILLVVRQGITERQQLQRSLEAIDRRKLLGTVVNSSSRPTRADYVYAARPRA
jgi:capsular exopolysaccharide synthesis family protein